MSSAFHCQICSTTGATAETAQVRCNVRRFRDRRFTVRRCAECQSLHCEHVEDLVSYYRDYPIRNQKLDYFSRAWYGVILSRLVNCGLKKEDKILDYGCNQGLFLSYLVEKGYLNCCGYDPYVQAYQSTVTLEQSYDWIISLDVIEHSDNPSYFLKKLSTLLKPHGYLCIETPNADGIQLTDAETYLHAIHVPYHQHILSKGALEFLGRTHGLTPIRHFDRWYMDSWQPGTSRELIESLMRFSGNDIDTGYEPPRIGLFLKHPSLMIKLLFGYIIPSQKKDHVMMIFSRHG